MSQFKKTVPLLVYAKITATADNSDVTSGVAVRVSVNGASMAAGTGAVNHVGNGNWTYLPHADEANSSSCSVEFYKTGANSVTVTFYGTNKRVDDLQDASIAGIESYLAQEHGAGLWAKSSVANPSDGGEAVVNNKFIGDAVPVAQRVYLPLPDNTNPLRLTVGNKSIEVPTGFTPADVITAVNSSTIAEFREIIASSDEFGIYFTARTAGVPFDIDAVVYATAKIETIQVGTNGRNEIQTITIPAGASGGTWALTITIAGNSQTASSLAHNISTSSLQTAIEALSNVGSGECLVTGSAKNYTLTFSAGLAGQNIAPVIANGDSLSGAGSAVISTIQQGAIADELQVMSVVATASSSTAGLQFTFNGESKLFSGLSAAEFQTFLESFATIGAGNVQVGGGLRFDSTQGRKVGLYSVRFIGALSGLPQNLIARVNGPSTSYATRIVTGGSNGQKEVQIINLNRNLFWPSTTSELSPEFTLTYDGETTAGIKLFRKTTDTAIGSDIISKLEGLTGINNVSVIIEPGALNAYYNHAVYGSANYLSANTAFAVIFEAPDTGNMEQITATLTGSTPTSETVMETTSTNEIQSLYLVASGGTFTISFGGNTTSSLSYGAAAASVETALEGLASIGSGNVSVSGSGTQQSPYLIEFTGSLASTNVAQITVTASGLTGGLTIAVATTADGGPGTNLKQLLTISQNASGGTLTLTRYGVSADIPPGQTAAAMVGYLEAIDGSGNVSVTGGTGGPFIIESIGAKAGQNLDPLLLNYSNLEGSSSSAFSTIERSAGPEHYDSAGNWLLGHVPEYGERPVFEMNRANVKYGLRQRSTFSVDTDNEILQLNHRSDFVVGQKVRLKSSGTLPSGLAANTTYYVVYHDRLNKKLKVSASSGGDPVNITTAGSGVHTISSPLDGILIRGGHTNDIGLAEENDGGRYYEYRPRSLEVDIQPGYVVSIGENGGSGSGMIRLDVNDSEIILELIKSAGSNEINHKAVEVFNRNDQSSMFVYGGELTLVDTSIIRSLYLHGGIVVIEDNCELVGLLNVTGGDYTAPKATIGEVRDRR